MPPRVLIKPNVFPSDGRPRARWGPPAPAHRRYEGPSREVLLSRFEEADGQMLHQESDKPLSDEERNEAILLVSAAYILALEKGRELKLPCVNLANAVSERKEFADAVSGGDFRAMLKCALEEMGRARMKKETPQPGGAKLWPGSIDAPRKEEAAIRPERREVQVLPTVYVDGSVLEDGKAGQPEDEKPKVTGGPAEGPPKFVTQFSGIDVDWRLQSAPYDLDALAEYERRLESLVRLHPTAFTPIATVQVQHSKAMVCMPISLGRYDAVPLFVQNGSGLPRLIFAYSSKSQDSWRRFAGCIRYEEGINYWKGGSEHLQNFDWRVQKAIDNVYSSQIKTVLHTVDSIETLSIYSPYMIIALEKRFQENPRGWIEPELFDISSAGNRPYKIVDFWWSGNADDGYGTRISMVASSRNGRYLHILAITGDGLVPKFIQYAEDFPLNPLGAPLYGVPMKKEDEWILTPIVEYEGQQERAWNATGEVINVEGTILYGGGRVRIRGLHQSPKSPYFELDNGMRDFYRLLRTGSTEGADTKMRKLLEAGGALPISAEPAEETEPSQAKSGWRYYYLFQAFTLYYQGLLDPSTEQGQSLMASYLITSRDIAVFKRYADYVRSHLLPGGAIPDQVKKQVADKLWNLSVQWAKDMDAKTVTI